MLKKIAWLHFYNHMMLPLVANGLKTRALGVCSLRQDISKVATRKLELRMYF